MILFQLIKKINPANIKFALNNFHFTEHFLSKSHSYLLDLDIIGISITVMCSIHLFDEMYFLYKFNGKRLSSILVYNLSKRNQGNVSDYTGSQILRSNLFNRNTLGRYIFIGCGETLVPD